LKHRRKSGNYIFEWQSSENMVVSAPLHFLSKTHGTVKMRSGVVSTRLFVHLDAASTVAVCSTRPIYNHRLLLPTIKDKAEYGGHLPVDYSGREKIMLPKFLENVVGSRLSPLNGENDNKTVGRPGPRVLHPGENHENIITKRIMLHGASYDFEYARTSGGQASRECPATIGNHDFLGDTIAKDSWVENVNPNGEYDHSVDDPLDPPSKICDSHWYRKNTNVRNSIRGLQKLRKCDAGVRGWFWPWWRDKQIRRKKNKKYI